VHEDNATILVFGSSPISKWTSFVTPQLADFADRGMLHKELELLSIVADVQLGNRNCACCLEVRVLLLSTPGEDRCQQEECATHPRAASENFTFWQAIHESTLV
jgi:hypothetical protein